MKRRDGEREKVRRRQSAWGSLHETGLPEAPAGFSFQPRSDVTYEAQSDQSHAQPVHA